MLIQILIDNAAVFNEDVPENTDVSLTVAQKIVYTRTQAPGPLPTPTPPPVVPPVPTPTPVPIPPAANVDFESELRRALSEQRMLDWTHGDVVLTKPIAITIDTNFMGLSGFDMHGSKIRSRIADLNKDLITIEVAQPNVDCRYLNFKNAVIVGSGLERDLFVLSCRTNLSWIYNFMFDNMKFVGGGRDGLVLDGSVFEGETRNVVCDSNARYGLMAFNDGAANDMGIVSAIVLSGGGFRKNGKAGVKLGSVIAYQEPRNIKIKDAYFVENRGPGINAPAGIDLVEACGFENNAETGVSFMNYAKLVHCIGSSGGPQAVLFKGYLNGATIIDDCSVEAYGGHTMRLGDLTGTGKIVLRGSGGVSGLTIIEGINVIVAE